MSGQILITGGAGFIGTHLARRLADAGYVTHLVDNHTRGVRDKDLDTLLLDPRVTFHLIDLQDRDAVLELGSNFNAIFHMAAIVGVSHVQQRPYEVVTSNVRILDNVIALSRRQTNFSRLLFASTSEVYSGTLNYFGLPIPTPENSVMTVTALDEPRTTYMLSKIVGEVMCHQSGLPFTIFRPHNIYGPRMGMAHVIPEQLQKIWNAAPGDAVTVYSVDHRRSFCAIDDAVEMLIRMLKIEACVGRTLNLGTEIPEVTIREVVQTCIDVAGKKLLIEALPPTQGSPERRAPDMQMTRDLLNYDSQVSLVDGITRTWEWYRECVFESSGLTAQ